MSQTDRSHLFETLSQLVANGKLKIDIDSHFAIADINEALRRAEQGGRNGKVIVLTGKRSSNRVCKGGFMLAIYEFNNKFWPNPPSPTSNVSIVFRSNSVGWVARQQNPTNTMEMLGFEAQPNLPKIYYPGVNHTIAIADKVRSIIPPEQLEMIRPLFESAPNPGAAWEIAPGLWWLRLPLASALDHINVYVLQDKDGWTLVDTGSNNPVCRSALEKAFSQGTLSRWPITRVIATHFHPDRIGLAGWLVDRGAILQTTRTCWLQARLLQLDHHDLPRAEELEFVQKAGMKGMELAAFQRRSPSDFANLVLPLPAAYERIKQGDILKIGDSPKERLCQRHWTIHIGNGHATLWSDDGFVITGDRILPGMSSNLSVHPSEPDADLVSEWIESCHRFARLAMSRNHLFGRT
jgi:glyoxylase-like metal-dependent hydrolase (beta-lactamase superfamily II)